jgi:hypothetical protein
MYLLTVSRGVLPLSAYSSATLRKGYQKRVTVKIQQIMSQAILGLPVTVRFTSTPCSWKEISKPFADVKGKHSGTTSRIRLRAWGSDESEQRMDAWAVRDEFLGLKTDAQVMAFLNKTGRFTTFPLNDPWGYAEMRRWQKIVREFLRIHPSDWLDWLGSKLPEDEKGHFIVAIIRHRRPKMEFWWTQPKKGHSVLFEAKTTLCALLASIQIDHLRNAKFRFCARADCRKPFEVVSKHERKYCNWHCAHLETVRRSRTKRKLLGKLELE